VASTTQTQSTASGGAQVFVFASNGDLFSTRRPEFSGWRGTTTAAAQEATPTARPGHSGYGCYGLNVAIGNIDDDDDLEIIVTYDNHEIRL